MGRARELGQGKLQVQSHGTCCLAWLVVVGRGTTSTTWLAVVVRKEGTGELPVQFKPGAVQ